MLSRRSGSYAQTFQNSLLTTIVVGTAMGLAGCAQNRILTTVSAATNPATTTSTHTGATGSAGATGSTGSTSAGSTTTTTEGASTGTTATTTSTPQASAAGAFASVTNFGDSITCGYYAQPEDGGGNMYSMEGYATLLDVGLGVKATNLCRGGDMAADMAKLWVYPNAVPALGANQLYTVLIGTNDAHFCGSYDGCISNWSQSLGASLAWLALPASDKVLGKAMTAASGSWVPDMGFGTATRDGGAALKFNVVQQVAGRMLYVAYRVFDASSGAVGTAVVTVDGVAAMTLKAAGNSGYAIATQNGTTDTVFLASVPLGAAGQHAVSITTSAAGGFFSVLWAGASTQNYASLSGAPAVEVGQITPTGNGDLNVAVADFNAALAPLVAGFVANGMNIVVAPTANAFDTVTEMSDMLHPNNVGHAKLAAVFASSLPQ